MRDDAIALAKMRLEDMLSFFGLNAKVAVAEEGDTVELSVEADTTGRLIGHHGENLRALQYILNQIVRMHTDERLFLSVDIGGYKKARAEQLTEQATAAAEKVLSSGEVVELKPMNAAERRIVHTALGEISGVTTESAGEDPHRYVVIKPSA
jgi:spoIIIJ-associated protein